MATNVFTLKTAYEAGKISTKNSKMPGSSFAISAKRCNVGSRLVNVEGSTCSKCYALRLQKFRPSVDKGWETNYNKSVEMVDTDPSRWVNSLVFQINRTGETYHRWFDSGDLPSVAYLRAIVQVVEATPNVKHWLPTREVKVVRDYVSKYGDFPANLVVRVSAPMIDQKPLKGFTHTSTVDTSDDYEGWSCPSQSQGNSCGDCRQCWNPELFNVSYPLH